VFGDFHCFCRTGQDACPCSEVSRCLGNCVGPPASIGDCPGVTAGVCQDLVRPSGACAPYSPAAASPDSVPIESGERNDLLSPSPSTARKARRPRTGGSTPRPSKNSNAVRIHPRGQRALHLWTREQ
jgi:hypothetical protein